MLDQILPTRTLRQHGGQEFSRSVQLMKPIPDVDALLMRALAGGTLRGMGTGLILPAVLIAAAYGVSDEFHQSFIPGRMASVSDIVAPNWQLSATLMLLPTRSRTILSTHWMRLSPRTSRSISSIVVCCRPNARA